MRHLRAPARAETLEGLPLRVVPSSVTMISSIHSHAQGVADERSGVPPYAEVRRHPDCSSSFRSGWGGHL